MHNEAKIRIRLGKALIKKNDYSFIKKNKENTKQ
jgi:hypothetical protein